MTAPAVPNLFGSILASVESSVTGDVKSWLVAQYAALMALPQQLAQLQRECVAITPYAASTPALAQTMGTQLTIVQGLQAKYPALQANVNQAYAEVQGASGSALATTVDVSATVISAQNFLSQVSAVDSALQQVIDQLLATGAITPAQADAMYTDLQHSSTTGWGTYVLYGIGAIMLYKILK